MGDRTDRLDLHAVPHPMSEYAVTAIGRDRPGIVAALSGALFELGGNIADSRMSILRGHFAVMLIAELPGERTSSEIEDAVAAVRDQLGLEAVSVSEVESIEAGSAEPSHTLSVYGADHPGIVHHVTRVLAAADANITDLSTRIAGGAEPVYVMLIEVAIGAADAERLDAALRQVAETEGVDVSLRELEVDAL